MDKVFSIGHSNHETDAFLALLKKYDIDIVLDVRSSPYSARYPQFNRELLMRSLKDKGIAYLSMGQFFGARQLDSEYYTPAGWLNYRAFCKSHIFKSGVEELDKCLIEGKIPALLCAEKDPFDCHRAIMVGRALSLQGYEVQHILADGSIQTQIELDKILLDKFFPHRDEGSIFDLIDGKPSEAELLGEAYFIRNEAIAWRKEEMED
ncbi:MAG: DUF488 domain-containing protein [Candidatus Cloacimonadaceae bacterium]|nr:DUF488 domain-containing protein [Candidatus Cloacimonadaceae bacterium]MDP3115319.1 DUF488 domain-containing protein [Candidatus Cloacimonadaceae bacterium]